MMDYDKNNWYWTVGGALVYSSAQRAYVTADNAGYMAFLAAGGVATAIDTDQNLYGVVGQVEALTALPSRRSVLIAKVDADADVIYGAVLGNRAQEYLDAYASALAYQAAGYTGTVPDDVQAWATAKAQTATWAADSIIATGTAWKAAKTAIRANRLAKKEAANSAADLNALTTVEAQWSAFVAYIKGQLGV